MSPNGAGLGIKGDKVSSVGLTEKGVVAPKNGDVASENREGSGEKRGGNSGDKRNNSISRVNLELDESKNNNVVDNRRKDSSSYLNANSLSPPAVSSSLFSRILSSLIVIPSNKNLVIPALNRFKGENPTILGRLLGFVFNDLAHNEDGTLNLWGLLLTGKINLLPYKILFVKSSYSGFEANFKGIELLSKHANFGEFLSALGLAKTHDEIRKAIELIEPKKKYRSQIGENFAIKITFGSGGRLYIGIKVRKVDNTQAFVTHLLIGSYGLNSSSHKQRFYNEDFEKIGFDLDKLKFYEGKEAEELYEKLLGYNPLYQDNFFSREQMIRWLLTYENYFQTLFNRLIKAERIDGITSILSEFIIFKDFKPPLLIPFKFLLEAVTEAKEISFKEKLANQDILDKAVSILLVNRESLLSSDDLETIRRILSSLIIAEGYIRDLIEKDFSNDMPSTQALSAFYKIFDFIGNKPILRFIENKFKVWADRTWDKDLIEMARKDIFVDMATSSSLPQDASSRGLDRETVNSEVKKFGGIDSFEVIREPFELDLIKQAMALLGNPVDIRKQLEQKGVRFVRAPPAWELGVANYFKEGKTDIILPSNATKEELAHEIWAVLNPNKTHKQNPIKITEVGGSVASQYNNPTVSPKTQSDKASSSVIFDRNDEENKTSVANNKLGGVLWKTLKLPLTTLSLKKQGLFSHQEETKATASTTSSTTPKQETYLSKLITALKQLLVVGQSTLRNRSNNTNTSSQPSTSNTLMSAKERFSLASERPYNNVNEKLPDWSVIMTSPTVSELDNQGRLGDSWSKREDKDSNGRKYTIYDNQDFNLHLNSSDRILYIDDKLIVVFLPQTEYSFLFYHLKGKQNYIVAIRFKDGLQFDEVLAGYIYSGEAEGINKNLVAIELNKEGIPFRDFIRKKLDLPQVTEEMLMAQKEIEKKLAQ
ncbi:MAG: hypothetical protein NC904_08845, partial [Candidatus Omnitrophica bacterium]|nr:hypothetical protein [Candidatus Omnitrophota bacterium]